MFMRDMSWIFPDGGLVVQFLKDIYLFVRERLVTVGRFPNLCKLYARKRIVAAIGYGSINIRMPV